MAKTNPFGAIRDIEVDGSTYKIADLTALEEADVIDDASRLLPNSVKQVDDEAVNESLKWRSGEVEGSNEAIRADRLV